MPSCSVLGCKNRVEKGGKHFYRFPKDQEIRKFWICFTKRSNYQPKASSSICEIHFQEKSFVNKKKRLFLVKEAVPTIFYKETKEGIQKIVIPLEDGFDSYCQQIESQDLQAEVPETDKIAKEERLNEIKTKLCRFCAEPKDVSVELSYFSKFNLNINNLFQTLELTMEHSSYLSDLVCEECFNQVVAIDIFRTKCKTAETQILNELENLDPEFKIASNVQTLSVLDIAPVKDELDDQQLLSTNVININDEVIYDETESHEVFMAEDQDYEETEEKPKQESQEVEAMDVYENELAEGEIIKNPKRNKFILKVYECLFCKKKYGGKRTFKSHFCDVKEIKCECGKVFSKVQAYRSHVAHSHGNGNEPEKRYCPMCKTVIWGNFSRFQQHRKKCNQERTEPIQCEICHKLLLSLNGYTIHKMFHESKKHNGESLLRAEKEIGDTICELCGKSFKTTSGYRTHKLTIHNESDEVYSCDKCGKICSSKPALSDHKRNTHKVQESPCNVCGKVFRTKVLLRKHMIYHDQTKRTFKCSQCPDKPGYFTNVALKRHQRSHSGDRPYSCNYCEASYTSNQQLKQHISSKHQMTETILEIPVQQEVQEIYEVREEYEISNANQQTQTILTIYPIME